MKEYIEREAAVDIVENWLFSVFGVKEADGTVTIFKKLRSILAADVREVVLCRDCTNQQVCRIAQYLGLDGFCSRGERQ